MSKPVWMKSVEVANEKSLQHLHPGGTHYGILCGHPRLSPMFINHAHCRRMEQQGVLKVIPMKVTIEIGQRVSTVEEQFDMDVFDALDLVCDALMGAGYQKESVESAILEKAHMINVIKDNSDGK